MARNRRIVRRNRNATSPWPFVALAGMATAFFPYAASGLVAPAYGVVLLLLVWLVLFVLCCLWFTRHPKLTLVLPVVAFVILFAVVYAGGRWLGWTA